MPDILYTFAFPQVVGRDPRSNLGDLLSNVGEILTHPEDDANALVHVRVDDVIDAIQDAPIVGGLASPVRDFVHGPMRDFAKTTVGAMVLTSIAVTIAVAVPFVGPQLEFFAFATPGFIAGGDFGPAWVVGYTQYIKQGVKFLSQNQVDLGLPDLELPPEVEQQMSDYTQKLQDGVKTAIDFLHALAPNALASMTYDQLSKELGIRYDSAVWGLAAARGNMAELAAAKLMKFDPGTGRPITDAYARKLEAGSAVLTSTGQTSMQVARLWVPLAMRPKASLSTQGPRMAGRLLQGTAPSSDAAVAVGQAVTQASAPSSSAAQLAIGVGAVVLLGGAAALWWFRLGGRTLWRRK